MSSEAEGPSLILIQRLADGGLEWIPLEILPHRVPAAPEAAYALIDRADAYEAPETLVAQRLGEDLIIEVHGTEVLVLDGFFATVDVAFYPTTDIAGGAGAFSGSPLTADSPVLAGFPAGEQVVWSAGSGDRDGEVTAGEIGDSPSPMLWVGLAAGGLGLAALAGGGGGSGGGEDAGGGGGGGSPPAVDTAAPTITSGATAPGIAENSGAGQVVYTATATDAGVVTYSLEAGEDSAAFSIDANTGAVRLIANPDFETKASYNFTVVATDTAGNSSERAVTLAINDIADETPPEVDDVAITSAVGAQNDILNAGDTVSVTVTMTENTVVDTSGGTPSIELSIGGDEVDADYVSGSGTTSLIFEYTIQAGDNDSNGIGIPSNALESNGGSLADAAGNAADLDHGPVPSNGSFVVDTTAPTLSSSTPDDDEDDFPREDDIVLTFSEDVEAGSGDLVITSDDDTRTIDVNDGSQVSISGNQVRIDPALDLLPDTNYSVLIDSTALTDEAGNPFAGISNPNTLEFETDGAGLLPFGLAASSSSDDGGRTFETETSEELEIGIASDDATLSTISSDSYTWGGSADLGSDARVMLVGNRADAWDPSAPADETSITEAARVSQSAPETRFGASTLDAMLDGAGGQTNVISFANMPAAILTSQGLV